MRNVASFTSNSLVLSTLLLSLVSLTSCSLGSSAGSPLLNRLKNRGAVPLSSQNPYLAGNLLLSMEMQKSKELEGFINTQGTPKAIEIVTSWSKPTILRMYYTDRQEYFVAEAANKTWIIQGPKKIPDGGMNLLYSIIEPNEEKAALEVTEQSSQSHPTIIAQEQRSENTEPRWIEADDKSNMYPISSKNSTNALSKSYTDPTIKLVHELVSKGGELAEVSPRGDLVHYVTFSGETLSIISRWYTYDARNVGRITRINNIKNPSQLEIGDSVVIPSYLLKNKLRLSEAALREISSRLSK